MAHTSLRSLFQRESPYAKTASYYLCFVILGLAMAAIGPVLPGLAEQTGSSLGNISFLFTARSLGYMIGSVIAGRLYDRYPGHPLIIAGLLLIMVAFVLIPITSILIVLFLLVIMIGITESSIDVGSNAMLVWIHGAAVPPFMNGLHFFFGLGAFLAPVLFAQFVSAGLQSTTLFWAMAGLVLPVIVVISTIPSPKIVVQAGENQPGSSSKGLIVLIAAAFFLYVGTEVGLSGWIYTYALASGLATEITAAYLTSVFWAAFTAGRFISIPLSRWFTPAQLLSVDLIGMLIGFSVLIFLPGSTTLWIGTALAGLAMASFFPSLLSFAGRMMAITAKVTGRFFIGASLGGMLFPWLIGQLFETSGPRYTLIVLGVETVLLAIVYSGLLISTRRRRAA